MTRIYCPHCGAAATENTRRCPRCGEALPLVYVKPAADPGAWRRRWRALLYVAALLAMAAVAVGVWEVPQMRSRLADQVEQRKELERQVEQLREDLQVSESGAKEERENTYQQGYENGYSDGYRQCEFDHGGETN